MCWLHKPTPEIRASTLKNVAGFTDAADRRTNPVAVEFVDALPKVFQDWRRDDCAEFFSRFGYGGGLTDEGARAAALLMNERREVLRKLAAILETPSGEMLRSMADQMWMRERVTE